MWASWSVTPCVASSSSSTTLADSMACRVLTTENFSIASNTLPLRRRPAVSISSNFCPSRSKGTEIASRVVPGRSKATRRSSPSQVLIRVDLPTLGRPATASLMTPAVLGLALVVLVGQVQRLERERRPGCGCPARAQPRPGAPRPGPARRTRSAARPRSCPRPCWPPARVGLPSLRRYVGDVVVLRRQAVARIDHEDHDVGLGHGLPRLLGHLLVDAALGRRARSRRCR